MGFSSYSGNLVGGFDKSYSKLTTETSSSQTEVLLNAKTIIVELYLDAPNAHSALGLRANKAMLSASAGTNYESYDWTTYRTNINNSYYVRIGYDFQDKSSSTKKYISFPNGQSRKVFALHEGQQEGTSNVPLYPSHLLYGPLNKLDYTSKAYIGVSYVSYNNNWITHEGGDGHIYKSITVNSHNQSIPSSLSVKRGYKYTFNMHTCSEAGYDGIIISGNQLSSATISSGFARCSGFDTSTSYTYNATSDKNIYFYYVTNSSMFPNTEWDTSAGGQTIYKGFSTGDIEIITEPIKTTVTLNYGNGVTSTGSTQFQISYGQNLSDIEITVPGKPKCNFAGYYQYNNSRNSPGKQYIDSSGKGVSMTWDIPYSAYTLYAYYNYSLSILSAWYPLHCFYCTSNPAAAIKLQTSTTITLGSVRQLPGTITSAQYNVGSTNHLGNLNMPNNNTVTIPSGTSCGDYKFDIEYTFTPDDTRIFIKTEKRGCDIWIIPTFIVNETTGSTGDETLYLTQKKDIPASSFTLNNNNLSDYFRCPITIPSTSTITYNNGQTASSTPQIKWYIDSPISFNSLGTTITNRQQVELSNDSDIKMTVERKLINSITEYSFGYQDIIPYVKSINPNANVHYYSRFSDLGVQANELIGWLITKYHISINSIDLRNIYSIDLLCKYLAFKGVTGTLISKRIFYFLSASYTDSTLYREANTVNSLSITVGNSSIYVGDTTSIGTTASFKSGDITSVNGTYSGYDSSIIRIS